MSESDNANTVELLQRFNAGSEAAAAELLRRYYPVVRDIVRIRMRGWLGAIEDIDDLVQESMKDAFKDLGKFEYRCEGSFRNWLSKLIENNALDSIRRQGADKRKNVVRIADLALVASTSLSEAIFPAGGPTPSEGVRNEEAQRALREYLETRLEEPYREVVVLRNYCGLSYEEIADQLGYEKTSTVRAIHSRALDKIRAAFPSASGSRA